MEKLGEGKSKKGMFLPSAPCSPNTYCEDFWGNCPAVCAAVSKPPNCSWLNGFGAAEGQMNVLHEFKTGFCVFGWSLGERDANLQC